MRNTIENHDLCHHFEKEEQWYELVSFVFFVFFVYVRAPEDRLVCHGVQLNRPHETAIVPEVATRVQGCGGGVPAVVGKDKQLVGAVLDLQNK